MSEDPLEMQHLVRRVPQFANGSFEARDAVACVARARRTVAGERIIARGTPGDALFFVVEGTFEARLSDATVPMGPGEFFGEIGLLFGQERTATVVSATDGLLLVIPGESLGRVYLAFPQIQPILDKSARERLQRT